MEFFPVNSSEKDKLQKQYESLKFEHDILNSKIRHLRLPCIPNKELIELPHDHPIFKSYFKFNNGLPKIHEHDNKPPQAFGIFNNNKLVVLYTYESDLGDGWEDPSVHNCPEKLRENALKMGVNIIYYALTQ